MPSDITFGTSVNEPETLMDHKISFIKRLSNAYHLTFVQRCAAIRDYKMYYDQSQKEVKFKIDDLVMVFWPVPRKGLSQKLLPKWKGPYKVVSKLGELTYKIEKGEKKFVVHVQRLKLYRPWMQSTE